MAFRTGLVLFFMGACFTAGAHDVITTKVTWSREISRLVFKHCASCHHESGSSFSLMTYQDARPWAKAIKEETLERRMPPWGAVKGFGSFRDDQGLTQEDLELISDWVEGGAPEGDRALLPKVPDLKAPAVHWKAGPEVILDGTLTLKQAASFRGIRPKTVLEGSSVQIVAVLPDGVVEPLLWLYRYKPEFDRAYYFDRPRTFPAGTRIQSIPPNSGALSLLSHPHAKP